MMENEGRSGKEKYEMRGIYVARQESFERTGRRRCTFRDLGYATSDK